MHSIFRFGSRGVSIQCDENISLLQDRLLIQRYVSVPTYIVNGVATKGKYIEGSESWMVSEHNDNASEKQG